MAQNPAADGGRDGHHGPMGANHLLEGAANLARAAAEGVDVLPDALALLDRHVGADTLSVSAMQLRDGADARADVSLHGTSPMRAEELALWPTLLATHPYLPVLVGGPMTASRVTDVVDLGAFERSELYQRLLRPRGSRFQAAALLERGPGSMLLLSLWRADRDFTDAEVARLESVRGLLSPAITFARALGEVTTAATGPAIDGMGRRGGTGTAGSAGLTRRQRQVAVLVEAGLTNDQIARRLGISSRTVRKHVESLFEVTGACTRTQVAVRWRRVGRPPDAGCPRCGAVAPTR